MMTTYVPVDLSDPRVNRVRIRYQVSSAAQWRAQFIPDSIVPPTVWDNARTQARVEKPDPSEFPTLQRWRNVSHATIESLPVALRKLGFNLCGFSVEVKLASPTSVSRGNYVCSLEFGRNQQEIQVPVDAEIAFRNALSSVWINTHLYHNLYDTASANSYVDVLLMGPISSGTTPTHRITVNGSCLETERCPRLFRKRNHGDVVPIQNPLDPSGLLDQVQQAIGQWHALA